MTALSLVHPEFTSGFFGRVRVAHVFLFFVFSYYVSLSSEFRVVMSITISARCLNRFYLQLFVGRLVFYLRYLCLFTYSGVLHISVLCFCFTFLRLVYPMLPVSVDCPFLIAPSVFSNVYLETINDNVDKRWRSLHSRCIFTFSSSCEGM